MVGQGGATSVETSTSPMKYLVQKSFRYVVIVYQVYWAAARIAHKSLCIEGILISCTHAPPPSMKSLCRFLTRLYQYTSPSERLCSLKYV